MQKPFLETALQGMSGAVEEMFGALVVLRDLSQVDIAHIEEEALLRQALSALILDFGMEYGAIYLLQEDGLQRATVITWQQLLNPSDASPGWAPGPMEARLMAQTLDTGDLQIASPPTGVLVSLPLANGGNPLGALNLGHPDPGFFQAQHRHLLPLFGNFLSQILAANRLLKKLDREVQGQTRTLNATLQEAKQQKSHYQTLSLIDDLTGLFNRRYFFAEGCKTVGQAQRYGYPLSLLFLDLDQFKRINGCYGHAVGDRVLCGVAEAIRGQLRESDLLARLGGEEFAILLPATEVDGALGLAERLVEAVRRQSWREGAALITLSTSVGVATLNGTPTPAKPLQGSHQVLDELVSSAERSAGRAKKLGGDCAVIAIEGLS